MIEEQNDDIINFLQHAKPSFELYESLFSYIPSQHHSVYKLYGFATKFLTEINKVVSVILLTDL